MTGCLLVGASYALLNTQTHAVGAVAAVGAVRAVLAGRTSLAFGAVGAGRALGALLHLADELLQVLLHLA